MFEISEYKQKVLDASGNLLIMGGPGSGKTTIALFKAKQIIESNCLRVEQKILFLSFARATISRVEQQAGGIISKSLMNHLEINTYHGFAWEILRNHGYLLCSKQLHLLPPHDSTSRLAGLKKDEQLARIDKLFEEEGLVHFDIFSNRCAQLLSSSCALRKIICNAFPVIILDEFQDTNLDEWNLMSVLGRSSRLIALADPDQRIYDFRGADPARVTTFIKEYSPECFDFGTENNRSNGTDIVQYGNDLLAEKNKLRTYKNIQIIRYSPQYNKDTKHMRLKCALLDSYGRVTASVKENWSIAILVPSNSLMMEVSDYLLARQSFRTGRILPAIPHEVAIETAGPYLASTLIASILEKGSMNDCTLDNVISLLCEHVKGRKSPTQEDFAIITALSAFRSTKKIRGKNRELLVVECGNLSDRINKIDFSGDIVKDWSLIQTIIASYKSDYMQKVSSDAKYFRLLKKGTSLYASLSALWIANKNYQGASTAVANAITQEHFASSTRVWGGINVMTIHKSKGKEFDEVIIYEGKYSGKIVSAPERIVQARLNLRVAVTRARNNVTILTPSDDPCQLL